MTDDDIRAVFERRAARAYAGDLRESILRVTVSRPHTARWRTVAGSWRNPRPSNVGRIALTAAAVVVAVVLGAALLSRPDGALAPGGNPDATPSPASSAARADAPTPALSTSPVTATILGMADVNHFLEAGQYRVADPFLVPFRVRLPAGWVLRSLSEVDASLRAVLPTDGAPWVSVHIVESISTDPCNSDGSAEFIAVSTVDEVVAALQNMAGFAAGPVTDVTVGGRPAKALELTNSIDTENLECEGGLLLPMWTLPDGVEAATNGGATEQIWVVNVDGRPVVIDGESYRNSPAGARGEIEQIVATIEFD